MQSLNCIEGGGAPSIQPSSSSSPHPTLPALLNHLHQTNISIPEIFNVAQIKQSSGAWPPHDESLHDEARIPSRGFLEDEFMDLPTYQPKQVGMRRDHSSVDPVKLTINAAIRTLEKDCKLARCVLFETAQRRRRVLVTLWRLERLRLTGGPRYLDMALSELLKLLWQGLQLIGKYGEFQEKALGSVEFQKECALAKRAILDLEKDFYDNIFNELQKGMIDSKKDIDHAQLIDRLKEVWCRLKLVYNRVTRTYNQILAEERDRRRRGDSEIDPAVPQHT